MRLTFVGDIAFGSTICSVGDPYRHIYSEICKGDLFFLNWEFPFTLLWEPESVTSYKGYAVDVSLSDHLLSPLANSIASIANNHIRDWGLEGINTTLKLLQRHDINPVGIDWGDGSPQKPFIITKDNLTIGFLAYAKKYEFSAHEEYPGAALIEFNKIKKDIFLLKKKVDHVVISLHWGTEFSEYPKPEELLLGRKTIDCGASLIIGHHAHVLQGYEKYKDGYIFYNIGSFIFDPLGEKVVDNAALERRIKSIIVHIELEKDSIRLLDIIPCRFNIEEKKVIISNGIYRDDDLNYLHKISIGLEEGAKRFYQVAGKDLLWRELKHEWYLIKKYKLSGIKAIVKNLRLRHFRIILGLILSKLYNKKTK